RSQGTHCAEIDASALRAKRYPRLEHSTYIGVDKRTGEKVSLPWTPTKVKISNLMEALESITYLPTDTDSPAWLDARKAEASDIIACRNGLLNIRDRSVYPHTAAFFNINSVPFDYNPNAVEPKRWLGFLQSVWPDDPAAIALLQEWFG
ncbi:NTP-binding protein, partial [Streptomyces lunaelactis]|nr:NTP-binding protein [Streptomyces lunaelactis]